MAVFFVTTGGFASSFSDTENSESLKSSAVKPLVLVCSHKELPTFSLLGTIHILRFGDLDRKAQNHLLSYDRFISETAAEDSLAAKDLGEIWGYRESDEDFETFKRSDKYNQLTSEEQEIFHQLSQHNLSFAHTYYLFSTIIKDEEYVQGMDESLEKFYKEKNNDAYHYLLSSKETLQSMAFFGDISYEELMAEDNSDDDEIAPSYPKTLKEAISNLDSETLDMSHEKHFRIRDALFVERLLEIATNQRLNDLHLNDLFGVGVNHLPGMVKALKQHGYQVSQMNF